VLGREAGKDAGEDHAVKREPIAVVAFLTQTNLKALGNNLKRIYPIDDVSPFEDLLGALDKARHEMRSSGRGRW
jgi:hypothetical protein